MAAQAIQVASGAALGTSPPTTALAGGATDEYGQVTFGSGTSTTTGALFTLRLGVALNGVGVTPASGAGIAVTAMNAATAALGPFYVTWDGAGGTATISCTVAPTASQGGTTYRLAYIITA